MTWAFYCINCSFSGIVLLYLNIPKQEFIMEVVIVAILSAIVYGVIYLSGFAVGQGILTVLGGIILLIIALNVAYHMTKKVLE